MKGFLEELTAWRFNRRIRLLSCGFALLLMIPESRAAVRVQAADELWRDDFDTGKAVGAATSDWKTKAAPGITIRIVDAKTTEPASPPYCVELRDDSAKERAELWRNFPPADSGKISAAFKLKTLAATHAGLQLRTAKGEHLCSIFFLKEGVMRYDHQGGVEKSAVTWAPGKWQEVQLEWFSDSTFSAAVEGRSFVEHARFVSNGVPGRIEFVVGSSNLTNKIAYVDNVKVFGPPAP